MLINGAWTSSLLGQPFTANSRGCQILNKMVLRYVSSCFLPHVYETLWQLRIEMVTWGVHNKVRKTHTIYGQSFWWVVCVAGGGYTEWSVSTRWATIGTVNWRFWKILYGAVVNKRTKHRFKSTQRGVFTLLLTSLMSIFALSTDSWTGYSATINSGKILQEETVGLQTCFWDHTHAKEQIFICARAWLMKT